jgi:hypothetical protein
MDNKGTHGADRGIPRDPEAFTVLGLPRAAGGVLNAEMEAETRPSCLCRLQNPADELAPRSSSALGVQDRQAGQAQAAYRQRSTRIFVNMDAAQGEEIRELHRGDRAGVPRARAATRSSALPRWRDGRHAQASSTREVRLEATPASCLRRTARSSTYALAQKILAQRVAVTLCSPTGIAAAIPPGSARRPDRSGYPAGRIDPQRGRRACCR